LIKLDFPALGRPLLQNEVKQLLLELVLFYWKRIINASNKSPVPLPEILAKV
jgi:hypothetical protein